MALHESLRKLRKRQTHWLGLRSFSHFHIDVVVAYQILAVICVLNGINSSQIT